MSLLAIIRNFELLSDQCPINIAIQANETASVCVYVEVLFKSVTFMPSTSADVACPYSKKQPLTILSRYSW